MTSRSSRRSSPEQSPKVGVFGLLGVGNFGNDGSLRAILEFLERYHPDAQIGALCAGPEEVTATHRIPAMRMHWYRAEYHSASDIRAIAMKALGKGIDVFRIAAWVRRYDVIIVPGMGVLESKLRLRPWGFPYSLFLLCASARVLGTKVALLNVGSDVSSNRMMRWLVTRAARLAHYRSYRDDVSRDAMRSMGLDVSSDEVCPDLTFALETPEGCPTPTGAVGVGVMAYFGGNDDRKHAHQIHDRYVTVVRRFVRWLADNGRPVVLFTGDRLDDAVVDAILADLRDCRHGVVPPSVTVSQATNLNDLMRQMTQVDTVVATRFHNVICALKLGKPTVSIGYAAKFDALMTDMGLGEFCQSARSLDFDKLVEQFTALESRADDLRVTIATRNQERAARLERQFARLSAALLPAGHHRKSRSDESQSRARDRGSLFVRADSPCGRTRVLLPHVRPGGDSVGWNRPDLLRAGQHLEIDQGGLARTPLASRPR